MSDNVLSYKGYQGSIETSIEDGILYGSILHIIDKITYEAETIPELKKEFEQAVEFYLEYCAKKGITPDKPFSGTFNIRVGMELHKRATFYSKQFGISLNDLVKSSISEYLNKHDGVREVHHHHHHYEVSGAFELHSNERFPPNPKPKLQIVRSGVTLQ